MKKIKRLRETYDFDDKLLRIKEEKLKLLYSNKTHNKVNCKFDESTPLLETNSPFTSIAITGEYYANFDEWSHFTIFTKSEPIIPVIEWWMVKWMYNFIVWFYVQSCKTLLRRLHYTVNKILTDFDILDIF